MRFQLLLLTLTASLNTHAADPEDAKIDFFEKKIRPILVEHCYTCHSAEI